MNQNVFSYEGVRGGLVDAFYQLLLSGKEVSYQDILEKYYGRDSRKISKNNLTN